MNRKRLLDLILVIPGMIALSPLFLIISVVIKLDTKGPVLFKQQRVGKGGTNFYIYKFRTMVVNAESSGLKLTVGNDKRITRSGRLLRKYKLDEIPQLINVLKGDMSFVGPRPEVPEYLEYYPRAARDRVLSVPPGITDYAAIQFRDENEQLSNVQEPEKLYLETILPIKISYYEKYIETRSLSTDVKIIFKTIVTIFK